MTTDADPGGTLAPDDAFAVLGNETRMEIIQALAEADGPLSFSALRERVGVRDSGQFNYHLDKLVGHFLEDSADGYALRRAGERIHEAVVSGAVTETPIIEPTEVDWPCSVCGAAVELTYQQEWVALSCTECPGAYGGTFTADEYAPDEQLEQGYLGGLSLPPAAVPDRSPLDVLRTAWTWDILERMAAASGTCPRCSAAVETTVAVCEDHDASDGLCEACNSRRMIIQQTTCENCHFHQVGPFPIALSDNTDLIAFLTTHGHDLLRPSADMLRELANYEETLLSREPFEARFTWTLGGDSLSVTVDDELTVVAVTEESDT